MNKRFLILIGLFLIVLIGFGVFFFIFKGSNETNVADQKNKTEYETNRVSIDNPNGINSSSDESNTSLNVQHGASSSAPEVKAPSPPPEVANETVKKAKTEEEIGSFSTKIYSDDPARQNNINITCSALTDTVVSNGSTFSFCNTLGPSTTAKGYEKADIFDANGNKKKGLGGGNCQISSTLYNAVLLVKNLNVIERHNHSNSVPYVKKGKDAAVAYGSYDLKFVNNTGYDVIIRANSNAKSVDVSLFSVK